MIRKAKRGSFIGLTTVDALSIETLKRAFQYC